MPIMASSTCRYCGVSFSISLAEIKSGRGQFCSRKCSIANALAKRWGGDKDERLKDRYNVKVVRRGDDECWGWTGFKHKGYGRIRIGPRAVGAHRVSYELAVGPIPEGMAILHTCDNPECTNPRHLRVGTNADNNLDRDLKGRGAKGETSPSAKLTERAVRTIRRRSPLSDAERDLIADAFGVERRSVKRVEGGISWRHVR